MKNSEVEEKLTLEWYSAYLTALGFNDPKKFPKSPKINESNSIDKLEMSDEEQAEALKAFKRKFSSK